MNEELLTPAVETDAPVQEVPQGKIYTPYMIYAAAFFGGPLGGAWLMARNFALFGRKQAVGFTWAASVLFTVLLLGSAFMVTPLFEKAPNVLIPLLYSMAYMLLAEKLQGGAVLRHLEAGGAKRSGWNVAMIAVAALLTTVAVLLAVIVWLFPDFSLAEL